MATIVLHGIIDGTVGLMAYADVHPIVAFETANLLFSLVVLAVGIRLARDVPGPDPAPSR